MKVPEVPTVHRSFRGGVTIEFQPDGPAWRERRYERGQLKADVGLVSLERVVAVLQPDGFLIDRACALDPGGRAPLARTGAVSF